MNRKQLAKKLSSHKFTVVQPAQANDADVAEFKVREAQAKKRAEARQAIEAKTATLSKGGITIRYNEEKNKSPLAKAMAQALK